MKTPTPENTRTTVGETDASREPTVSKSISGTVVFAVLFVSICFLGGLLFGKVGVLTALTGCAVLSVMPIYYAFNRRVNGVYLTRKQQYILCAEGAVKLLICLAIFSVLYQIE